MQFNTTIDETEVLYEDLSEWTTINIADHRPPPLYVEIYLDTAELKDNRRLVLADDDGQRHDITEIVASSSGDHRSPPDRAEPNTQVILERWKVELGVAPSAPTVDLNESLANLYKKGVVLFRSLFTYARFLPAWKYLRSMAKLPASQNALQLHYRIVRGGREPFQKDMLNVPLVTSHEPVTEVYNFGPISSPAGPLSIEVTYRTNTKFQFEDHEALLSSRLMGEDAYSFSPSLASGGNVSHKNIGGEPGSLPIRGDNAQNRPDRGQAYGSTRGEDESESGDAADNTRLREEGTNAIDIPLSPRTYPHGRRSSSVAQQQRTLNDDDVLPFGMRSTSLPVEERTELSLSQLLHLQESARTVDSTVETSQEPDLDRPASRRFIEPREETSQRGGSQPVYRPRFPRDSAHGRGISAIGRGLASAHGSSSSLGAGSGPGTGSGTSDTGRGGSRFSFTARAATMDDDEPLLFAMSDFTSSRRSLEEGRGGSNAGSGIGDRAGAESGGGSRRGNRRAY
ncbi:hypothetical protein B0A49_04942 [Cryomyces minteri]|uniref:Autophagy-related protein 13 n=1 Tax=Cryomyces minteri TaxID=331657 RepID=A0A4U0XAD7_9PEZI|nr:hypothetical protein B0A49_04942 [Cryomyces minteri]